MRPNVSQFKVYEGSTLKQKYWANYADENILLVTHEKAKGWIDLTDPIVDYVSTHRPEYTEKRTPLQNFLKSTGRVRQVDGDYIKWSLRGRGDVAARVVENMIPGVTTPGLQGTEIPLKLNTEWYVPGDVLFPDKAKDSQVVVQGGEPIGDGSGYIYYVQIVDKNPNAYLHPLLLEPNVKWIKLDSVYGEGSEGYGSTIFTGNTYLEFRTSLTDYGKTVEVTNKAHDLNLSMRAYDSKDRMLKDYPEQIISMIEAEFLTQTRWEKELRLFYGRSAGRAIIDHTIGTHRRIGPGLLEFLEDGNVVEFPVENFTLSMFTSYLQAVWFNRVLPGQRNVTVYTGQMGLEAIQKAIAAEFGGSSIQADFNTFVSKGGKTYGEGYQGLVYQTAYFTEIQLFPFGRLRFEHWPILDSRELNGSVLHPRTGLPLSSYQYIILDYGYGDGGGNNIELLQRRGANAHTYVCGTWSPRGAINDLGGRSMFVATGPQRRYQLFHTDTYGLRVKDVTLTAWFVPVVDL